MNAGSISMSSIYFITMFIYKKRHKNSKSAHTMQLSASPIKYTYISFFHSKLNSLVVGGVVVALYFLFLELLSFIVFRTFLSIIISNSDNVCAPLCKDFQLIFFSIRLRKSHFYAYQFYLCLYLLCIGFFVCLFDGIEDE